MLLSVIIASHNSAQTIQQTLDSIAPILVRNDCQLVVVDGGSSDNTAEIISRVSVKGCFQWLSEPDSGIYDAFNKGIDMCSGEFVFFLNSDDWVDPSIDWNKFFNTLESAMDEDISAVVYAQAVLSRSGAIKLVWKTNRTSPLWLGWVSPHSSTLIRNRYYREHRFDDSFEISGDYRFLTEFYSKSKNIWFRNDVLVVQRAGGVSTNGLASVVKSFHEDIRVATLFSYVPIFTVITKKIRRLLMIFQTMLVSDDGN